MRNKKFNCKPGNLLMWGLMLLPYLLLIPAALWYYHKLDNVEHSAFIVINKADMSLSLYNYKGELLQKAGVATGKNAGTKATIGDNKTPEGIFTIASVEDASNWSHDFKDDSLGTIKGAYGPWFIRLNVPGQKGIGIHGTHDENSIGGRASEGCIRMRNADLLQLAVKIKTATVVVITPGVEDIQVNRQPADSITVAIEKVQPAKEKKAQQPVNAKPAKPIKPKLALKDLLKDKHKQ
jgi:L,D-transpeptidase catalytic domain